jgi:glycosyltransferase involved in cell wall biosynthesis
MSDPTQPNSLRPLTVADDRLSLPPITKRYLLVTNIKCYRDQKRVRYLDPLWQKDLIEHFQYLKNFTLAAPCQQDKPPKGAIALDSDPSFSNIQFIDLPSPNSFASAIVLLPATIVRLWQAIGKADLVHTGVAGWPIPMGWLVTPIVRLRRKFYILIVESAPWRLQPGLPVKIKARITAPICERLNRWCVNTADLAIFTQQEYLKSLLTKQQKLGYVIHASWIDEENIISEAEATEIWHKKISPSTQELKVLFAGRLNASKGILVLLEAMKILDKDNIPVKLDILGQGELLSECERVSKLSQRATEIKILGTVPYGFEFFQLLQEYHAIVVPSISDEQPRIVYDAYSQGIPVLATDTAGLRDCIQNGKTGLLANSNDPIALADLLKWSWQNLSQLKSMGFASLKVARNMTHQEMHRKRWQLLLDRFHEWQHKVP